MEAYPHHASPPNHRGGIGQAVGRAGQRRSTGHLGEAYIQTHSVASDTFAGSGVAKVCAMHVLAMPRPAENTPGVHPLIVVVRARD